MDVWIFFSAFGGLFFFSLTSDRIPSQGKGRKMKRAKEKEKKKKKSWPSSSPFFSFPSLCFLLPGSAGRQMTGVCGRLITPGWVFSNLFNGSLLKEKKTR